MAFKQIVKSTIHEGMNIIVITSGVILNGKVKEVENKHSVDPHLTLVSTDKEDEGIIYIIPIGKENNIIFGYNAKELSKLEKKREKDSGKEK